MANERIAEALLASLHVEVCMTYFSGCKVVAGNLMDGVGLEEEETFDEAHFGADLETQWKKQCLGKINS